MHGKNLYSPGDPVLTLQMRAPGRYKVLILNDDFTPIDFVVNVIEEVFDYTKARAESLAIEAHINGSSICGIYPYDVAEMKVFEVMSRARANEYPLECVLEENLMDSQSSTSSS